MRGEVLRHTRSGVHTIVPLDVYDRRCQIARLGGANGRWSELVVDLAISLASKASAVIDQRQWADYVDDLAEHVEPAVCASPPVDVGYGATRMR